MFRQTETHIKYKHLDSQDTSNRQTDKQTFTAANINTPNTNVPYTSKTGYRETLQDTLNTKTAYTPQTDANRNTPNTNRHQIQRDALHTTIHMSQTDRNTPSNHKHKQA